MTEVIDLEGATIQRLVIALHRHVHESRAEALTVPAAALNGVVASGAYALLGWSVANAGAAAEAFALFDGVTNTGQAVAVAQLAAGTSDTHWLGPAGIRLRGGLFQTSGADVSGAVFVAPLGRYRN